MPLRTFHQFENHAPSFFRVRGKVLFFTVFSIGRLPPSFGSPLLFQQVAYCVLKFLVISSDGHFKRAFKACFLLFIRSVSISSASKNQSGLFLTLVLVTSLAFFTICFSSSSSSSDSGRWMAQLRESTSKNLFPFFAIWQFVPSKSSVINFHIGLLAALGGVFLLSQQGGYQEMKKAVWSLCAPSNCLLTFVVWHSWCFGRNIYGLTDMHISFLLLHWGLLAMCCIF